MSKTAYLLKLGDGSGWLIIATPDTRAWVERFATIMQLRPNDQRQHTKWPRMFFFLRHSGKDANLDPINPIESKIEEAVPRSGWKAHDWRSLRIWFHRTSPDIICEIGNEGNHELDIVRMWTSMYGIYLRVQDSGGLLLHAALLERDGKGILLAGPGGSGKSTLSRRLPRPWYALSDDQALIVRNGRKSYLAHPIPTWSDHLWRQSEQRWNVGHYVRLAAIFFIQQAKSEEVVPIGQGQAAVFINHSSQDVSLPIWWNLDVQEKGAVKKKNFDNSCKLAKTIPAYILDTRLNSLDGRLWDEIERILS